MPDVGFLERERQFRAVRLGQAASRQLAAGVPAEGAVFEAPVTVLRPHVQEAAAVRWEVAPGSTLLPGRHVVRWMVDVREQPTDSTPTWQVAGRTVVTVGGHDDDHLSASSDRPAPAGSAADSDAGQVALSEGGARVLHRPSGETLPAAQLPFAAVLPPPTIMLDVHDGGRLTGRLRRLVRRGERAVDALSRDAAGLIRMVLSESALASRLAGGVAYSYEDAFQDSWEQVRKMVLRYGSEDRPNMSYAGAVAVDVRAAVRAKIDRLELHQSEDTGKIRAFLASAPDVAGDPVAAHRAYAWRTTVTTYLRGRNRELRDRRMPKLTRDVAERELLTMVEQGRARWVEDGPDRQVRERRKALEAAGIVPIWSKFSVAHMRLAMQPRVETVSVDSVSAEAPGELSYQADGYQEVDADDLLTDWLQRRALTDDDALVWLAYQQGGFEQGLAAMCRQRHLEPVQARACLEQVLTRAEKVALTGPERHVWELSALEGLPPRDVARVTGQDPQQVRATLRRAKAKVAALPAPEGVRPEPAHAAAQPLPS